MHQLLSSIAFLCLLALPLAAQEETLHGTWEGTIVDAELGEGTVHLIFKEDGTFNQIYQGPALLEGFADDEATGAEALIIDSFHQTGTYQVAGDSLWVDIDSVYYIVGGEKVEPVEVMIQLIREMARLALALGEITEEDYPEAEQTVIDEFLAGFNEEEMLVELAMSGTYVVEGDSLFLTTTEERGVETVEFHRIDDATAVVQTTWGGLKAAWRP
ncbi:MAG: hypothetical protein OXM01_02640 [Gemmatimonadota bacterium]|nr:hypothetical protein [Gemmatimonadota bacterium]